MLVSKMLKNVKGTLGAMFVGAIALTAPSIASAEQIALTFVKHDLILVGEYLGYADDGYVIATENGTMHIPAAMVSCEGSHCASLRVQLAES